MKKIANIIAGKVKYFLPFLNKHQSSLQECIIVGNKSKLIVKKTVSFGGEVMIVCNKKKIVINKYTMIAAKTYIGTLKMFPELSNNTAEEKPVNIGKHVWIGTGAIILPGSKIGDFSVVAAGCVVDGNVPEGAIVAGNPFKIIKYRDQKIYNSQMRIYNWAESEILKKSYLAKYSKPI